MQTTRVIGLAAIGVAGSHLWRRNRRPKPAWAPEAAVSVDKVDKGDKAAEMLLAASASDADSGDTGDIDRFADESGHDGAVERDEPVETPAEPSTPSAGEALAAELSADRRPSFPVDPFASDDSRRLEPWLNLDKVVDTVAEEGLAEAEEEPEEER